jgi:DNA-binding NarL/FixJ family response regulator
MDTAIHPSTQPAQPASSADILSKLTPRERQIAEIVCRGLTNKEIGAEIGLSRRTIETHIDNIRRKTAIKSKARLGAALRDALAAETAGCEAMGD